MELVKEGGVGIFGFAVAIFKVGFSRFFDFGVCCGFPSFEHLVFGFQPEYKRFFGSCIHCVFFGFS